MNQWRKFEDEKGFPYYVNEKNQCKNWDHPNYALIKQQLDECNNIKYSTYRLAMKFRVLQKSLCLNDVLLTTINGVFEKHRLGVNENSLILESYDLEAVLSDIFFATNKQFRLTIDIDLATELTMNFLYNVFDLKRLGTIQVFSTKLLLALLSKCKVHELYQFLFAICADHNNCLTRLKLRSLLINLHDFIKYLHEDINYGFHFINDVIDNCFSNSPGLIGMDESTFLSWMEKQQDFLHFIPILYRIRSSETVIHHSRCTVCKSTPTIGLRYKCLKCYNYIQCQQCFLTGRTSASHKTAHLMREYCFEGMTKEYKQSFVKRLCNILRCSKFSSNISSNCRLSAEKVCLYARAEEANIQPLSSPHVQLEGIIHQMELNDRELQQMLKYEKRNEKITKNYLETHRLHVTAQIHKLKTLLDHLQSTQPLVISNSAKMEDLKGETCHLERVQWKQSLAFEGCVQKDPQLETYNSELLNNYVEEKNDSNSHVYAVNDLNSWIAGRPQTLSSDLLNKQSGALHQMEEQVCSPLTNDVQNDLDEVLAKLQQILANNFVLDESLGSADNGQLKTAVNEVEDMLSSLRDGAEHPEERETAVF